MIIAVLLSATFAAVSRDEEARKFTKRVSFSVSADDQLRNEISGYLNDALHAIGDIVIVDSLAQYQIDVVAMDTKNKRGEEIGITLSTVILRCFDREIFEQPIFQPARKRLERLTTGLSSMEIHKIRLCTHTDLQSACAAIIADFNTEQLDRDRKMFNQIMEMLKRYKKKKPSH